MTVSCLFSCLTIHPPLLLTLTTPWMYICVLPFPFFFVPQSSNTPDCISRSQIRRHKKDKSVKQTHLDAALSRFRVTRKWLPLNWQESVPGPKQSYMGALWIHLCLFNSWCTLTGFHLLCYISPCAHSAWGGGLRWIALLVGILQSQLSLTRCINIIVIVFGSLSFRDNVVTSSVLRASGTKPRPSILSCLPLISISPTSHHIKATDAHISLYISVSLTVVDSVVVRHSGPSPTNSLITAHSPKCVCNVGNHFQ